MKTSQIAEVRQRLKKAQGGFDPILKVPLVNTVLDHDHTEGFCRGALDRDVNQFIGKVESAYKRFLKHKTDHSLPYILEEVSKYLKFKHTAVIHPRHTTVLVNRFKRANKKQQIKILNDLKVNFSPLANKKDLVVLYKTHLRDSDSLYNSNYDLYTGLQTKSV